MAYTTVLFILLVSVFIGYVSWIWDKYGVLPSISDSYYHLPKNLQPIFTLFCWGFSIPAIILGSSGLMFFAGAGIAFVGAAAAFKEQMTSIVHVVGAMMGVLLSQLAIWLQYGIWQVNIAFLVIAIPLTITRFVKIKGKEICPNRTWWVEIAAFLAICVALGITLFNK
jgi:hypothetical protein